MKILVALSLSVFSLGAAACTSSTSPVSPSAGAGISAGLDANTVSADAKPGYAEAAKPGKNTIVDIVLVNDGEFDVLQAAVVRAGLVDVLSAPTQYTVFAPTDAAFVSTLAVANEAAAIAAIDSLPLETLTNILLYHVTNGRRNSNSVLAAPSYQTLNGTKLTREKLAAAGFAATDISASNGIVHVINAVLLP